MKNLTIPQALVAIALLGFAAVLLHLWPDRYYYQRTDTGYNVVRVNRWTGRAEVSRNGADWKSRP